jgi:hypothetical protein
LAFIIDDLIQGLFGWQGAQAQEREANAAMGVQERTHRQQRADQTAAHDQARATWERVYGQQRADQQPFLQAGQSTLADIMSQLRGGGFDSPYRAMDPSQLGNDPGFQFRLSEGQKALERSAAARGGLRSGGFMKGLARYSQGLASDEFQNAWGRNHAENMFRQGENLNRFGRMSSIAGMGQNAAQSLGGFGSQFAGNVGGLAMQNAGQLGAYGSHYADAMSNLHGARGNAQAAGWGALGGGIGGGLRSAANLGMLAAGGGFGGGGYTGGMMPSQYGMIPTQGAQLGGGGGGGGFLTDLYRYGGK